jgi:hypothetical protein
MNPTLYNIGPKGWANDGHILSFFGLKFEEILENLVY